MKKLILVLLTLLTFGAGLGFWWITQPIPDVVVRQDGMVGVQSEDEAERSWNKEVLARFSESSLRSARTIGEVYRFILLPTFDAPILVKISKPGEAAVIVTKTLDGQGGYELGKLSLDEERPLSDDEWSKFAALVEDTRFWETDAVFNEHPMPDGASWRVEANKWGTYHRVDRIWPSTEFYELCLGFLRLAGKEADYEGYR